MHIAQIAPLAEPVLPQLYGGTERVVYGLTEADPFVREVGIVARLINSAGAERLPLDQWSGLAQQPQPAGGQQQERQEDARMRHNRLEALAFNRVADDFLKPIPEDIVARTALIAASARIRRGHVVLDVGTGTGVLLPYILRARPAKVVACDLSEEMLKRARQRFGNDVLFVQADVVDLSPALGPFDRVLCNAVFGNLYDQQQALAAICRLLKPRGWLVISHPMGRDFVHGLMQQRPGMVLHDLPDEQQLAAMCAAAGFRVVSFVDEPSLYIAIAQRAPRAGQPRQGQRRQAG